MLPDIVSVTGKVINGIVYIVRFVLVITLYSAPLSQPGAGQLLAVICSTIGDSVLCSSGGNRRERTTYPGLTQPNHTSKRLVNLKDMEVVSYDSRYKFHEFIILKLSSFQFSCD